MQTFKTKVYLKFVTDLCTDTLSRVNSHIFISTASVVVFARASLPYPHPSSIRGYRFDKETSASSQSLLQVSWFRKRDSHILTVDRTTFVADDRFSAWHEPGEYNSGLNLITGTILVVGKK